MGLFSLFPALMVSQKAIKFDQISTLVSAPILGENFASKFTQNASRVPLLCYSYCCDYIVRSSSMPLLQQATKLMTLRDREMNLRDHLCITGGIDEAR